MRKAMMNLAMSVAVSFLFATGGPVAAEEFGWIMKSIGNAGDVDNGDGHWWSFKSAGAGEWEVEGAQGYTASVSPAGENKIAIDGFPDGWGANGTYVFTKKSAIAASNRRTASPTT